MNKLWTIVGLIISWLMVGVAVYWFFNKGFHFLYLVTLFVGIIAVVFFERRLVMVYKKER